MLKGIILTWEFVILRVVLMLLCRCTEYPAPWQPCRSHVELPKVCRFKRLHNNIFGKTKLDTSTG